MAGAVCGRRSRGASSTAGRSCRSTAALQLLALTLLLAPQLGAAEQPRYEPQRERPGAGARARDAEKPQPDAVAGQPAPRHRRALAQDAAGGDRPQLLAAALARLVGQPRGPAGAQPQAPRAPKRASGPAPGTALDLAQCRARYAAFLPVMHEELMLWAGHGINETLMDAAFDQQTHLAGRAGLPIVFRCAAAAPAAGQRASTRPGGRLPRRRAGPAQRALGRLPHAPPASRAARCAGAACRTRSCWTTAWSA
jgi:hypothetical protein